MEQIQVILWSFPEALYNAESDGSCPVTGWIQAAEANTFLEHALLFSSLTDV